MKRVREALPKIREVSGEVGRPFQRSVRGREALPVVWVRSGRPLGGPGVVGRTSRRSGRVREAFQEDWKALLEVQLGSLGPPGGLGGIERPYQRSGRGQEALTQVWEGSVSPPGHPG